jgi:acyl-CoA synthetase (AMP-forming)/AMP-acid ligase II
MRNERFEISFELRCNRYINDVEATKKVFDKDGYFTTGDIARREGDCYFIVGRASVDGELAEDIFASNA